MKNKLKIILFGVMYAVCLQVPVTAQAVDLPFVPADDSETDTVITSVTDDNTPIVTDSQTTETTSEPTTAGTQNPVTAIEEEKTTTAEKIMISSDSGNNELPVISPECEATDTVTALYDSGLPVTDENDSLKIQTTTYSDSKDSPETSGKSSLPVVISVICGTAIIGGAVISAIFRRLKK